MRSATGRQAGIYPCANVPRLPVGVSVGICREAGRGLYRYGLPFLDFLFHGHHHISCPSLLYIPSIITPPTYRHSFRFRISYAYKTSQIQAINTMVGVRSMTLLAMLATAVVSSPTNLKRQTPTDIVVFRTDLREGEGQSPRFKNLLCKSFRFLYIFKSLD